MPAKKPAKFERPKNPVTMEDVKDNSKTFIDKIVGDTSKMSATKQILIGASTGWVTGHLAMKVGKLAACAVGGGIILLEIAHEKGYIKINWDKVNQQIDKVADQVEEQVTGEGPRWTDKMERYVDRKLDKAEELIKNRQSKVKRWYSSITGSPNNKLKEIHIFLISFVAGVAVGVAAA